MLPGDESVRELLFGEAPSRIVISAEEGRVSEIERLAQGAQVPVTRLGRTGGDKLGIEHRGRPVASLALTSLREAREDCLTSIVGR